jgi:hypothetical protein
MQAYKHIFTSPSSVEFDEPKATRSGNACLHGMTSVMKASVAYIATQVPLSASLVIAGQELQLEQVRFALSSMSIFSRTDKATDSE